MRRSHSRSAALRRNGIVVLLHVVRHPAADHVDRFRTAQAAVADEIGAVIAVQRIVQLAVADQIVGSRRSRLPLRQIAIRIVPQRGGIKQSPRFDGQCGAQREAAVTLGVVVPIDRQPVLAVINLRDDVIDHLVIRRPTHELTVRIRALHDGNPAVLLDQLAVIVSPGDVRFSLVVMQRSQIPFIVGTIIDRIAVHADHILAFAVGRIIQEKIGSANSLVTVGIEVGDRIQVGVDDPLVEIAGIAQRLGLLRLVRRRGKKVRIEHRISVRDGRIESIAELPQRSEGRLDRLSRFILIETRIEEIVAPLHRADAQYCENGSEYQVFHNMLHD